MSSEAAYTFRPYLPTDIPFIHSSWGASYFEGVRGHKQLNEVEFHSHHRPIREKALNNPNCAAIVCCSKNDPDHIIGWILVEKPNESPYIVLHYLYIKNTFQREGIGKELLKAALPIRPVLYTHATDKSKRIMKENWKANRADFDRFFPTPHLIGAR